MGGGASDVRVGGITIADRVIVAGGGGGGATGLKYKNQLANSDGLTSVRLKAGVDTGKVVVKGKGAALVLPAFPLTNITSVVVQLVNHPGAGAKCWGGVFPSPPLVHDVVNQKFVDKTP